MSDTLIWIILLFVFLIIIGLYNSEFTPLKLSEKQKILDLNYVTENFTPKMREMYRPYVRDARIISEGFYEKNKY
jgi:hypothetical protein